MERCSRLGGGGLLDWFPPGKPSHSELVEVLKLLISLTLLLFLLRFVIVVNRRKETHNKSAEKLDNTYGKHVLQLRHVYAAVSLPPGPSATIAAMLDDGGGLNWTNFVGETSSHRFPPAANKE